MLLPFLRSIRLYHQCVIFFISSPLLRFVGLLTARGGTGTRAWINVRNVVDGQGVEFLFDLYSPTVHKVETLKLERRLDDELHYLRDAPQEYSTVPTGEAGSGDEKRTVPRVRVFLRVYFI